MASVRKRPDGKWRARYRDDTGREHARHFARKIDAQQWLDGKTAELVAGVHIAPSAAKLTVGEWASVWIEGYATNRASTVNQARVHLRVITEDLGTRTLRSLRASDIRSWVVSLQARGYSTSYVHALYRRLAQLLTDAVHDGKLPKSPISRRTSPPAPKQRAYVATTEQVWALHDALPAHFRPVVLLGAFAGLRVAEIAALRVEDVDFMRGIITPAIQWPAEPLKTDTSKTPIPIPHELALELNRVPAEWGSDTLVVGAYGRAVTPYTIEAAFRLARAQVEGIPEGFRIHDLRHYFASLLIAAGLDIKTVQTRLRHASAKTTLDTYGHMWPDKDESARAAVSAVLAERFAARADSVRTSADQGC